uniref:Ig-like domain-containing protein n=1 Tax=Cyprinus carpio TaxID=7962 RepID=A0A8C1M4Z3_CYPCA
MKIEESVICVLFCVSVSSSSSQTQISAGQSVTLSCQLYSYSYAGVSCDVWIRSERIELFWVNQASVKKQTRSDSRYQISAPDHCLITLNTTLLNEDDNREWRCEVTQRDQVKTSVTYTVKSSAQDDTVSPVIPVHTTKSTTMRPAASTQGTLQKNELQPLCFTESSFVIT